MTTTIDSAWPGGARFAFAIFDDTDRSTVASTKPVYDLMTQLGVRSTKSVWPIAPSQTPRTGGDTCADPDYLRWVLDLEEAGHEIGYHNATDHPSTREATIAALDRFAELFGRDPRVGADHVGNREAVYWGAARLSGWRSTAYRTALRIGRPYRFETSGEDPDSPYFWGDVLHDRIDYWRNFTFSGTDTLAACPPMPYHDRDRPFVRWWFAATHAPKRAALVESLDERRLDDLEAAGGACLIYTHLGVDSARDGIVDPELRRALERLAERPAWFATTSELLDHLRARRGSDEPIDRRQRARLERGWVADQLRARGWTELRKGIVRRYP